MKPSISFRFELALAVATLLLVSNLFRARQIADLRLLYRSIAALNVVTFVLMGNTSFLLSLFAYWQVAVWFLR